MLQSKGRALNTALLDIDSAAGNLPRSYSDPFSRPPQGGHGVPAAGARASAAGPINPATGQIQDRAIECRAVSVSFLEEFTRQKVHSQPDLMKQATAEAIVFLEKAIVETKAALKTVTEGSASTRSRGNQQAGATETLQRGWSSQFDTERDKALLQSKLERQEHDLRSRRAKPYMTTRDAHQLIIKAETDALMCRYVELPGWGADMIDASGVPFVGDAEAFLSHSWDSPWESLVNSARERATADRRNDKTQQKNITYLWIDIFAVNQHWPQTGSDGSVTCPTGCPGCAAIREDLPDWESMAQQNYSVGFGRVLNFSKHVCVLMEPWHAPRPPTRVWCLFEMYRGLSGVGGTADVVLSRLEKQAMQVALAHDWTKFESLVVSIDARDAEVTVQSDRDNIFGLITADADGFSGLNAAIRESLYHWLITSGEETLAQLDPSAVALSRSELNEEAALHKLNRVRKCQLRCVNRFPRAPVQLPVLGYLVLSAVAFGIFLYLHFFGGRETPAAVAFSVGLAMWGALVVNGAVLRITGETHQIRRPPLRLFNTFGSSWVLW
jgi:hypothetical protein